METQPVNATSTLHVRRAGRDDVPALTDWTSDDPVAWIGADRLTAELATGNYRPEWCWVAERAGRLVGRALWWGRSDADRPATLDCLTTGAHGPEAVAIGSALVRAGLDAFGDAPVEFNVDVSPNWTSDPAAVEAARWRHEAAHLGGFSRTTERISFARTASDPEPPRPTRLRFVPAEDATFRALFAAVASGSLDDHTNDMVAREGVDALADDDLDFYRSLPGDRRAWRTAHLPDGTTVGFIIPTRTAYDASISYLGVLPEHRGHGYVHDLLAEMTHVHHDDGQARIVGTTDAVNTPMRAAFERAGFTVTRVRIVHAR
ncbi:GNAT family N-acetyltransferase [Curtobacterium herbarum]|uniref:GNAT family N-acetyltransferase n=1 Tax=Curtobacterium herbarum TaxID=150122 RepID=A0ABP4K3Q4_9MICO|nr:GNAT family N-acetyltransferase [Curtobacterium herbarum]MBM7475671.1 ribosomal protein S18 acetylase RimI-like enzyme [Curtobacterium herbarum]MCS6543583.1 GNAT family N-acetyltransferase [Curtobacterium herbarum]